MAHSGRSADPIRAEIYPRNVIKIRKKKKERVWKEKRVIGRRGEALPILLFIVSISSI
jgi:hypothetical protein